MSPHRLLKVFLVSLSFVNQVFSYLDIGELNSFQYNIDISDKPVLLDESKEKEGILLSSRRGQKYQCLFESVSHFSLKEEEDTASKSSVPDLLKPLENQPCLILTTGWWTYELCYKKYVRQYHVLDQKIDGDVLILGNYADEFDWGAAGDKKTPEKSSRYHSQQYVNGSMCDLTGTTRSAEIRFRCKEDNSDVLEGVEEPVTCSYVLHVTTPRLCKHPALRPVPKKHSLPVTCSPVLGDKDYKNYLKLQKKMDESKIYDGKEEKDGALGGKSLSTEDGGTVIMEAGGEASILEFGDSRIKFYVLSHDGMKPLDEFLKDSNIDDNPPRADGSDEEKNEKDAASEIVSDNQSPSSSSSSTESSSSLSTLSSVSETMESNTDDASLRTDGSDAVKIPTDDSGEDVGGDDDDLFNVFNKFLSNRRLKSFLKRKGKGAAIEESATATISADVNEGGERTDEVVESHVKLDESDESVKSEVLEKMDIDDAADDNDDSKKKRIKIKADYKAKEALFKGRNSQSRLDYIVVRDDQEETTITWEGENKNTALSEGVRISIKEEVKRDGEGESVNNAGQRDGEGVISTDGEKKRIIGDDEAGEKKTIIEDAGGREGSDQTDSLREDVDPDNDDDAIKETESESKINEVIEGSAKGVREKENENNVNDLKNVGAQVLDNLFKKGGRKLPIEEQKAVQMILAIVRQPDRDVKEATRHEKIEKNYNFNWNEHRKEVVSALRENEKKDKNVEVVVMVEKHENLEGDGAHVIKKEEEEDLL